MIEFSAPQNAVIDENTELARAMGLTTRYQEALALHAGKLVTVAETADDEAGHDLFILQSEEVLAASQAPDPRLVYPKTDVAGLVTYGIAQAGYPESESDVSYISAAIVFPARPREAVNAFPTVMTADDIKHILGRREHQERVGLNNILDFSLAKLL